jgi:hypothetical protein
VINDIGLKRGESYIMSDIGSNFLSISDLRHPNLRVSMSESKEIGLDIDMDMGMNMNLNMDMDMVMNKNMNMNMNMKTNLSERKKLLYIVLL